ncbi:hypothetical protein CKAH01_12824 [Colletotrichum kahawae]|uniref:Uncharacterized protein n=1 Tax=Colletotrichum kahawae TaxID=34407 RepID=A0AAE0DC94_COLKA|nr:hypothetical protein CKAH01_12824 [Colletotrichum kahawae]
MMRALGAHQSPRRTRPSAREERCCCYLYPSIDSALYIGHQAATKTLTRQYGRAGMFQTDVRVVKIRQGAKGRDEPRLPPHQRVTFSNEAASNSSSSSAAPFSCYRSAVVIATLRRYPSHCLVSDWQVFVSRQASAKARRADINTLNEQTGYLARLILPSNSNKRPRSHLPRLSRLPQDTSAKSNQLSTSTTPDAQPPPPARSRQ